MLPSVAQFMPRYRFEFGPPGGVPSKRPLGPDSALAPLSDMKRISVLSRAPRACSPFTSLPMFVSMASIIAAYTAIRWSKRSLASSVSDSQAGEAGSRGLSGHRRSIRPMAIWRRYRASRSRSHPALYLPRCLAIRSAGAISGKCGALYGR